MSGFLNDGLRDLIAVGGAALALLQTWLAVKAVVGAKGSGDDGTRVQASALDLSAEPDRRTAYEQKRAAEDVKLLRDYGYLGVFCLLGSVVGLAAGVAISSRVIGGHTTLSSTTYNLLLAACMVVFVGGAICGAYGVWNWSKGRSASNHLLVVSLVRAGVVVLTIITAGALWWCLGENRDALIVEALWNFILSAGVILLASAIVFVKGVT